MKKTLWLGVAAAALVAGTDPAFAQAVKDKDRVMEGARYSSAVPPPPAAPVEPVVREYRPETPPPAVMQAEQPARVVTREADPYAVPYSGTQVGGYNPANDDWLKDRDVPPSPADAFTGFYAGLDIGYGVGWHAATNPTGPDGTVGMRGFEGGVFAGFGWAGNDVDITPYIGVEIGYQISDQDGNLNGIPFDKENTYMLTVRPGFVVGGETLAYGILGYGITEIEGAGDSNDVGTYMLGLGAEFKTALPVNFRVETVYVNHEEDRYSGIRFEGEELNFKAGAVARF